MVGGVAFDGAGERFAVTVTRRGDPANVYVIEGGDYYEDTDDRILTQFQYKF